MFFKEFYLPFGKQYKDKIVCPFWALTVESAKKQCSLIKENDFGQNVKNCYAKIFPIDWIFCVITFSFS